MVFKKIDIDSINSITNNLDLFRLPGTNVMVQSSKVFEILTSNPITSVPYHFKISASENFIDLTKCHLFSEFRIRKLGANGQIVNLEATDNIAPIQMIGQTFIKNMRISINGREVFNANSLMPYKSYFSHELSYPAGAKDSHLQVSGYYRDHGSDTLEAGNGYNARKALFSGSKTVQFISKIDSDLFNQPLYLVNHCDIDVEIDPQDANFTLIAPTAGATTYFFEVVSLKLYVKMIELMDGLALDIARRLEQKPARYSIRKTMMKALYIEGGRFEFNSNLFTDQVPRRITLGLVKHGDYVGNIASSPFNFKPFNVREISIIANGRSYPQAPYSFDYENGRYARAFQDMNDAVGFANSQESNGIGYKQFGKTHCIYVFNLTNSGEDQGALFDLIRSGTTAVSIKFASAVPAGGLTLVVMGEADSLIMLDKNRIISTDTTI